MYMFEFILEFLYSTHTYSLTNIWLNVPWQVAPQPKPILICVWEHCPVGTHNCLQALTV